MHSFDHDGVEIAYIDEPPTGPDRGEPILLIHGFASNHSVNWVGTLWVKTLREAGRRVIALDKSKRRMERVRQNLARTGLAAELAIADALEWQTDRRFDAVLLDAPCTATGTCRRHPEVLHRIGPRQIAEMAELQARLLERAQPWVKPGGTLVYAVCSLEREEGEAIAAQVPLETVPILPSELPSGLSPALEGWLRTDPGMLPEAGGLDGFFVGRFGA